MKDQTLNQALQARGWTTQPGTYGRKKIFDRAGVLIGQMTASETWDTLHDAEADDDDIVDEETDGRFDGVPRSWMGESC
jgi:hypothetical protein